MIVRGIIGVRVGVRGVVVAGRVLRVASAGPGVGGGRGRCRVLGPLPRVLCLSSGRADVPRAAIRGHILHSPLA